MGRFFEHVCVYCGNFADLIPVSFVLGFYVSVVVKRWWDCFSSIPWPDSLAFFVSTFLQGQDERGRLMRRTIMRYANLSSIITLRCISPPVKKRFPTLDHLVDAGLLLGSEREVFEQLKTNHSTYWMPLVWAGSIASRARKEGRIRDDFALKTIVDEIARYRSNCGGLFNYDWISIPLVYTQVTTLAVYTFFLATLFGSQGLDPNAGYKGHEIDLYVPIFSFLRFFFYMGWLKVAETLVNPFGEDDDDFEMNYVIDRNIQVSYLVVDEMHQNHPELLKDQYWNQVLPPELPYTVASKQFYCFPHEGSTACIVIPPNKASVVSREKLPRNSPLQGPKDEEVGMKSAVSKCKKVCRKPSRGTLESAGSSSQKPWAGMLSRFLSKDSTRHSGVSAQSSGSQTLRMKPSASQATSMSRCSDGSTARVTPQSQERQEAIFHLSDLSLADSKFQSPTTPEIFRRCSRGSGRSVAKSTPGEISPGVQTPDHGDVAADTNVLSSSADEDPSTVVFIDGESSPDDQQLLSDLEDDFPALPEDQERSQTQVPRSASVPIEAPVIRPRGKSVGVLNHRNSLPHKSVTCMAQPSRPDSVDKPRPKYYSFRRKRSNRETNI